MSRQVKEIWLRGLAARMDRLLNNLPENLPHYVDDPDNPGRKMSRPGAVFYEPGSSLYGRTWKICQFSNEGGGESVLIHGLSKADLYDNARSWLDGYSAARKQYDPNY